MPSNNRRSRSRRRRKILGMSQELFFTIVFSLVFLVITFTIISIVQHFSEKSRITEETQKKDEEINDVFQQVNNKVAETDNYKSDTIVRLAAWDNILSDEIIDDEKIADIKTTLKDANIVFGPYTMETKQEKEESTYTVKIVEKRDVKFAILSYQESDFNEEKVLEDLSYAKEKAKIIVCLMNWGKGDSVTSSQEEKARFLIDNGASIIIGSTPSGLQKMEMVQNKDGKECLIAYGVGTYKDKNSENTKIGIILNMQIYITKEGQADIYKIDFTPIYQGNTKVYDIKDEIKKYEAGEGDIDKNTYDTLKRALQKINSIIKR